jgi:hypothetical protein
MNQIINMVIRQVMRKLLNKGIDAGFNKASNMRRGGKQQPVGEIDDYGNPVQKGSGPTGQNNQSAKQTKQAMKMARRAGKF